MPPKEAASAAQPAAGILPPNTLARHDVTAAGQGYQQAMGWCHQFPEPPRRRRPLDPLQGRQVFRLSDTSSQRCRPGPALSIIPDHVAPLPSPGPSKLTHHGHPLTQLRRPHHHDCTSTRASTRRHRSDARTRTHTHHRYAATSRSCSTPPVPLVTPSAHAATRARPSGRRPPARCRSQPNLAHRSPRTGPVGQRPAPTTHTAIGVPVLAAFEVVRHPPTPTALPGPASVGAGQAVSLLRSATVPRLAVSPSQAPRR
jgi:hypothetical protein